jgi:Amt family ammonium transporter
MWMKAKLGYDDALDAFGVHGVGGFVGAILTGVFAVSAVGGEGHSGLIDGNAHQVWVQFLGTLATIVWSGVVSYIILKVVDMIVGLRVTKEVEVEGLDINLHGEIVH